MFGLTASHSGDMYFELCYKPDIISTLKALPRLGGLDAFWENIPNIRPKGKDFRDAINIIAMAACYSPNPAAPHGFDLPFDLETGELREDVWARWLAWDPVYLVDKHLDALRSLRLIYLDAGLRDEFNLQYGARILCRRLEERGIPYVHEEFDDGHMNIRSFPKSISIFISSVDDDREALQIYKRLGNTFGIPEGEGKYLPRRAQANRRPIHVD